MLALLFLFQQNLFATTCNEDKASRISDTVFEVCSIDTGKSNEEASEKTKQKAEKAYKRICSQSDLCSTATMKKENLIKSCEEITASEFTCKLHLRYTADKNTLETDIQDITKLATKKELHGDRNLFNIGIGLQSFMGKTANNKNILTTGGSYNVAFERLVYKKFSFFFSYGIFNSNLNNSNNETSGELTMKGSRIRLATRYFLNKSMVGFHYGIGLDVVNYELEGNFKTSEWEFDTSWKDKSSDGKRFSFSEKGTYENIYLTLGYFLGEKINYGAEINVHPTPVEPFDFSTELVLTLGKRF
jgi:hypothetical protein